MPIIAHSNLPSFTRLKNEGEVILSKDRASNQEIRELHIGLLNMMPDAALEATERQFFRLVGRSNQIAQFYLHPFTLKNIKRNIKAKQHIDKYYQTFKQIKNQGLDALIITGTNTQNQDLASEIFFTELTQVIEWAYKNVASTLCSCLATHAAMEIFYQQKRQKMTNKYWGVFQHTIINNHPLVRGINNIFTVPHSRYNQISPQQFNKSGVKIIASNEQGIHLAVSPDLFRIVFFQGHPEYDTISLLKEYKREIINFKQGFNNYPEFPQNYFNSQAKAILLEFKDKFIGGKFDIQDFPEKLLTPMLNNNWVATTNMIINNWIGLVYQTTNIDIKKQFMDELDNNNPLGLLK